MAHPKWKNPFYALLLPTGMLFCLTVTAYVVMAFRGMNNLRSAASEGADHPLMGWLQTYGNRALLIELTVLAVLTLAAIATDSWWAHKRVTDEREA